MLQTLKKYIYGLILCLFISNNVDAQRFSAGLILGINASQIDGDLYAGYSKIGIVGGIQGFAYLTDKLDLGIELRYSQIGSRSTPNNQNSAEPFSLTLNYAEVPVSINYKDWYVEAEDFHRLHFHFGLTYARLISSKLKDQSGSPFEILINSFNDNYFGALIGTTYFINEHFGATIRFNRAILLLYKNDGSGLNNKSLLSKHLTFSTIYKF